MREASVASSRNIFSNSALSLMPGSMVLTANSFSNPRSPLRRAAQTIAMPPRASGTKSS
jgi:hypothetical protein